ncbi:RNA polymerase sigma factor [Taklimakanibacter deserti]|uniref:RNA polymerase sigma factor n=1 Tax=Taklimakanibacter deserti TaxID=2267839 RepID=UPI000E652297
MSEVHHAIDAIWRIEQAKLIAGLARFTRDLSLAEELAQDALLSALEQWPRMGIPEKPGAWLMTAAKNRAIDKARKAKLAQGKHVEIGRERDAEQEIAWEALEDALDDPMGDDLLRLIFVSCHPVLSTDARTALTLRLISGLTTEEIARGFLQSEPTIAQRIVRAKRTLAEKHVPFEIPRGPELTQRLASVLEVIYLTFNEGYSATGGDDWMRPQLCEEALRLARILCGLMPEESEVFGLTALMEIQASRIEARTGPSGEPILLLDQNRALWDQLLIRRGLAALARAEALSPALGRYGLQAAIAACHARAREATQTDWARIASLYDALAALEGSPVVDLNRAVAHSMVAGPQAGLDLVDALIGEDALKTYHLLPSVRGDFLFKLGRLAEAEAEFRRAASLTQNAREKSLLLERAAACRQ